MRTISAVAVAGATPGKAFDPHGTAWILCIGGTDGRDGWECQIKELGE